MFPFDLHLEQMTEVTLDIEIRGHREGLALVVGDRTVPASSPYVRTPVLAGPQRILLKEVGCSPVRQVDVLVPSDRHALTLLIDASGD